MTADGAEKSQRGIAHPLVTPLSVLQEVRKTVLVHPGYLNAINLRWAGDLRANRHDVIM